MGTIKVQINSAEALERFLGSNPELTIEIQKQVAYSIINKFLPAKVGGLGEELIEKILCDTLPGTGTNYRKKELKLKPEIQSMAEQMIKNKISDQLERICEQVFDVNQIKGKSLELLNRQAEWIEKELTNTILSNRIEKMVDEKIKARMGIK